MAENQRERWYFTKEQIFNTPSRKCGIDYDKEISYRQQAANLIQDMGQRLQVSQLCINTAIVYMHRFYVYHSFTKFHRNQMAACALFLAAKVEEQPRKLEHVIRVAHMCLNRDQPPLDVRSEQYAEQAQELILNENILLQALGFDVAIDHPHTHVVRCCQLVRASKDLAQTSYFMATNSLHLTVMCLQLKPTVVACVCIHLVCKWSNWEIPRSSEGREWFWYVDHTVTLEQLEELTAEFLTIFKNSQSRLKRRVMQHGQGAAAALLPLGPSSEPHHKPSSTSRSDDREQRKEGKERMAGHPHPSSRPSSSSLPGSQQQHRPSSSSDPQQRSRPPVIDPKAASSSSSSRPSHHHHHHHQQKQPSSHSSSKPLPPPGSSAPAASQTFSSSTSSVSTSISSSSKPSSSSSTSSRSHMDPNQMPKQSPVAPAAPPTLSSKAVPGRMPLFNSDWGGSSDTASKSGVTAQSGQSALSAALGFGSQEPSSDGGFQLNDSGWDLQFGAEPPSLSPTSALENMLNSQNVPSQTHQQSKLPSSSSFSKSSTSSTTAPLPSDAHLHMKKEKPSNMPANPYGSSSAIKSLFDVGDDIPSANNSSRHSSQQHHQQQQLQQPHPQQQPNKPPLPSTPIAPGRTTEQDIKNILSQALAPPLPLDPTKSWSGPPPQVQNANPPPREKLSTKSLFSPPSEHSQPASVKTQEFSVKEEIRIADPYGHTKRRSASSVTTTTTTTIDMSVLGGSTIPAMPAQSLPRPASTPSTVMLNSTLEAPPVSEKASSVSPSHKSDKKKKKKEKHKHKEKDKSKDKDKEGGEEKKHKKHKNKDKEKEKEKESKKKVKDELPPLVNNETPKLKITIPKTKLTGLDATPSSSAAAPSDTPVKLKIPKQKIKTENGETLGGSGGDLKLKISLGSAAAANTDTRKRHLESSTSSSQFPGAPSMKMPRMDGPPSMGSLSSRSNGAGSQDRNKAPPTRPSSSSKVNSSSSAKAGWPGNGGH